MVYILLCGDGSFYTGVTSNLEGRLGVHYEGTKGYTSGRLPVELVWCCEFPDMMSAIRAEKQVKGWSRAKKQALIDGDIDLIHQLATCQNMTHFAIQAALGKYKPKRKPGIG
jgi:putative endonuclease